MKDNHCDEITWGRRSECDIDQMSDVAASERLGVCDTDCDSMLYMDADWRTQRLADRGLQPFNGTGETVRDGVSFTRGMYDDQVCGKQGPRYD